MNISPACRSVGVTRQEYCHHLMGSSPSPHAHPCGPPLLGLQLAANLIFGKCTQSLPKVNEEFTGGFVKIFTVFQKKKRKKKKSKIFHCSDSERSFSAVTHMSIVNLKKKKKRLDSSFVNSFFSQYSLIISAIKE